MSKDRRKQAPRETAATARNQPRREDILRAAAQLFHEKGFAATTTQDIADRVGMLKGSLYYYIDSKEAMLIEIVKRAHRLFTDSIGLITELDGTPLDRIWSYVYRFALANTIYHVESAVFLNELRSLSDADRADIIAMRDTNDELLRKLLADGQAEGLVHPDIEPKLAATAILSMCLGISRWFRTDGEWSSEHIARSYANLAVAQVSCTPDAHSKNGTRGDRLHVLPLSAPAPARRITPPRRRGAGAH